MPEMAFPDFVGAWMKVFGLAGEGQSIPSTNLLGGAPYRFRDGEVAYGMVNPGRILPPIDCFTN